MTAPYEYFVRCLECNEFQVVLIKIPHLCVGLFHCLHKISSVSVIRDTVNICNMKPLFRFPHLCILCTVHQLLVLVITQPAASAIYQILSLYDVRARGPLGRALALYCTNIWYMARANV